MARDSWWDTVDFLSPSIIGLLVIKEPDTQIQLMRKWIASDNMWYRRSALIMQLKYAKSTNFDILKSMISDQSTSKEFFIQKAAGWALRQYSRVDPIGVSSFISKHQLPPLTKREGMRLILKEEGKW
ncbi:MAG: DNA alkylation repair protein [Saprospiraceae bacterium]|nr:DNA alkylation repair protein [Candidatus Defluviibacterium haderslevense]